MELITLSPSKLNLFNNCPKCFWDSYAGDCPLPRGIMASLPGGMDLIFKDYVDQYRGDKIPGLDLPGVLFKDMAIMKKWRFWRSGPSYLDTTNQIKLVGALDDCLVDGEFHDPLDWKSKGSEPKDDGSQYYQTQMDCYNLMLEYSGYMTRNKAHLVYFYPLSATSSEIANTVDVTFAFKPYTLECSKERAKEKVIKAAECLRGKRPKSSDKCEHCHYLALEDLLSEAS